MKANLLGFSGAQTYWYNNWTGRYASSAAISAFAAGGDIVKIYRFAPIAVLSLTFLSFLFLLWSIARDRHSLRTVLLAAGTFTILFVSSTPDPAQTFYWLSGSFTYQLGNIFFTVLLGLLGLRESCPTGQHIKVVLVFLAAALAAVAAIGSNEVSALLTVFALSGGTLVAHITRRHTRPFWTALLAVAIVAASVSLVAPGNNVRAASMLDDGMIRLDPWWAALAYVPWVALRVLYWLSNIGLWASAFVLLWATSSTSRGLLFLPNGKFDKRFLVLPILWIFTIFLLNALGFLLNRYPLPERAESVVNLVFLIGWYPSFIVLAHYWFGNGIPPISRQRIRIAGLLVLVSLLGSPNIFEAYKDVYRGYRYDKEMRARFDALRTARQAGRMEATVGSISKPPRTLFATDFVTDAQSFRNSCASEYFGLKSIRLGAPTR